MDTMISSRSAEARKGDEQAAVRLIEEYHLRIYAFLRRLSGNNSDAEDLTQRTFTRAWQALESFEGRSSIASWVHGIAYHVYVDWRRAQRPSEFHTDEWWASCPSSTPSPAELVETSDLAHAVYEAVDHLDLDLRNAVHLRYYQALTVQETADALGVAVSTIKYRLDQALDELQAVLVRQPALAKHLQTP